MRAKPGGIGLAAGKRAKSKAGKGKARRRRLEVRRARWRRIFRTTALVLVGTGFVAGFATARYAIHLDRIVRARFEGRLFRVPSRVMSAPTTPLSPVSRRAKVSPTSPVVKKT